MMDAKIIESTDLNDRQFSLKAWFGWTAVFGLVLASLEFWPAVYRDSLLTEAPSGVVVIKVIAAWMAVALFLLLKRKLVLFATLLIPPAFVGLHWLIEVERHDPGLNWMLLVASNVVTVVCFVAVSYRLVANWLKTVVPDYVNFAYQFYGGLVFAFVTIMVVNSLGSVAPSLDALVYGVSVGVWFGLYRGIAQFPATRRLTFFGVKIELLLLIGLCGAAGLPLVYFLLSSPFMMGVNQLPLRFQPLCGLLTALIGFCGLWVAGRSSSLKKPVR